MVEAVKANYRAMRSVNVAAALLREVPEWPSLAAQERVVAEVLDDAVVAAYAPAASYTRAFLKALIADVEGAGAEVAEELYTRYVALCMAGGDAAAPSAAFVHCTLTHHGRARSAVPAPDALPLRLSRALNPVGLTTWPAGYFLTELLLDQHERVDGKVVLELGAGVGITGIALAKWAQPTRVVMTDYLANVIDNLNHNIEINGVEDYCGTACLDWEEDTLESCRRKGLPDTCDLVIAADCVYDPALATALTKMLGVLLSDAMYPRAHVLIANTVRQQESLEACFAGLQRAGIAWRPLFAPASRTQFSVADGITQAADFAARVPQLFAYERPLQLILWECFRIDTKQ